MPGHRFGFVKLLASSGSHCTKWADEQHWPAGFESRLVPDLPLPFIPTLIGFRAFDHVSSRVWWEAATNKERSTRTLSGANRHHEARVLRYRGCTHLTTTSCGRFNNLFLRSFLRATRGVLLRSEHLWRSLMIIRNRRPGGKHEEDSLWPSGLNHRSVPLVRLAAQR